VAEGPVGSAAEEIKEQLLAVSRQFRGRLAAFSQDQRSEIAAELRQIEEALRESEGRFHLVAQAAHEAVWDWNLLTGEVWRNKGFQVLFGYSEQDITNSPEWWSDRVHPEDRERVMSSIPALLAGSVHPVSFEYRFRRADGSYADVFDRSFFLTNTEGRPVRMIGAMLDISERKRLEAKQRESGKQLRALTRQLLRAQESERRRLARALHDEFAQLLTGLLLQLDLCAQDLEGPVANRLGEALKLAHDLMARVRALSLDLRPVMLDDMGLVHSLLWHVENFSQRTGVRVDFQHEGLERRLPGEVETAVYRLVQESLANVSRHAKVPSASLKVWADQDSVYLEAEDKGIGFDPSLIDEGVAAGLSEIRERVSLLGGELKVQSAPGQGTLLRASLPLALPSDD
jgi:PAS domain S-box-containing protein